MNTFKVIAVPKSAYGVVRAWMDAKQPKIDSPLVALSIALDIVRKERGGLKIHTVTGNEKAAEALVEFVK